MRNSVLYCTVKSTMGTSDLIMYAQPSPTFDAEAFFRSARIPTTARKYQPAGVIYSQGGACDAVLYIKRGEVRLSVLSRSAKEAVVAILGAGSFFGESALTGQTLRIGSATAHTSCTVIAIATSEMRRLLREEHAMADGFIAHLLTRNIRIEEDLIDQMFNSAEKRLARTLLLLGRYHESNAPHRTIPRISQETLAEMVGTTRSRVNFFMKRFRRLGFISDEDGLKIHSSLLNIVLHD